MNRNDSRTAARIRRITAELTAGDLDQWQLADRIVLSRRYMREYVQDMIERGELHVVGWKRYGVSGPHIPVCRLGPGQNLPMPDPVPDTERRRATRKAKRADQEAHQRFLRRQRARRMKPPPMDPILAALHGRAASE